MRVKHPPRAVTECPVYACVLAVEDHEPEDEGRTWHYDDTTGVHWPTETALGGGES